MHGNLLAVLFHQDDDPRGRVHAQAREYGLNLVIALLADQNWTISHEKLASCRMGWGQDELALFKQFWTTSKNNLLALELEPGKCARSKRLGAGGATSQTNTAFETCSSVLLAVKNFLSQSSWRVRSAANYPFTLIYAESCDKLSRVLPQVSSI